MSGGYDGPGRYRHYKGGEYEVLGLAARVETFADDETVIEVVYRSVKPAPPLSKVAFVTRTLDDFNEHVQVGYEPSDSHEVKGGVSTFLPRFQRIRPITALYFGTSGGEAGHYWATSGNRSVGWEKRQWIANNLPWGEYVDGKLYPNEKQGECNLLYKDGWTAIAFANRIDDSRGGCNSNFFFDTTLTFEQAVEEARRQFPSIMERIDQAFELRLIQDQRGTTTA